jgi:alpha-beta hydrolase superfamily lysophospholipase
MSDLDPRPEVRPVYLGTGVDAAFGMLHVAPADALASTAVVLTPPWGWDDVSSYRARRIWAAELAAAGHPTLRIELPGTGDSGGSAADPARLEASVAAVTSAVAWLRVESGCPRIAVIGLGLGGLTAAMALAAGAAMDDLVLWGVPARGRGCVRQMRAFAGLQGSRYSLTGEPEPGLLPDGWLEVNGFVLSADTIGALESVALVDLPAHGLQRALLLDQDGIPTDPALAEHLSSAGVELTTRPGPGWGPMTFHPEYQSIPRDVFDTVGTWLADAPSGVVPVHAAPSVPTTASTELDLTVDEVAIRETPISIDGGDIRLFAILARPVGVPAQPVGAVLLNAGAVRRIGPNRIWVETARRWAARGVATVRIDLEGIGDSEGDAERYRDVAEFYVRDEFGAQISAAIDALAHRGHGPRIVLAGLCAGGFWALRGAAADDRVTAALLLNPGALDWHPDLLEARQAARVRRLREIAWWRRILGGGVPIARIGATVAALARRALRAIAHAPSQALGRLRPSEALSLDPDSAEAILDRLSAAGTTVVMAFSVDEPLYAELERAGFVARSRRWPTLHLDRLPGRDHTLRPIVAQRAAQTLLDREIARELDRVTASATARSA